MTPLGHVATTMEAVRNGLHAFTAELLSEAGRPLAVGGAVPDGHAPPTLVLLPYQTLLESQSTTPTRVLVPSDGGGSAPEGWALVGALMTRFLVERFPKRPQKAPGLGPLDPRPALAELPEPVRRWYADRPAFRVGPGHGLLPSVSWRHPFSYVVRHVALVAAEGTEADAVQLTALAVLAAGVRHRRFFEVEIPPEPAEPDLVALAQAMRDAAEPDQADALARALDGVLSPRRLAVGLYPHHELTDNDLAQVMNALRQPMQPTLVFALRISLGGGPELGTGAMPAVGPVGMGPR